MSNELVKMNENLPAHLQSPELAALFADTVKETQETITPVLPRIKVAPGGINLFMRGEDSLKEIKCIVLKAERAYALWKPKEEPGLTAFNKIFPVGFPDHNPDLPLCSSLGGINGTMEAIETDKGHAFGRCVSCRFYQFKSDFKGGAGKACKNGVRMMLIVPGSAIPNMLTLPPTSIRSYNEYASYLLGNKLTVQFVYTTMTLEKKDNSMGQPYSIIKFAMPAKPDYLSETDAALMMSSRIQFAPVMTAEVTAEEFDAEAEVINGHSEPAPSWESGSTKPAEAYQVEELQKLLNYKDFNGQGLLRAEALNATNADNKLDFDEMADLIGRIVDLPDLKKKK